MKILKYSCKDTGKPGWRFSEVEFSNINLLVGDTASGKTSFLNTFFNLGVFIVQNIYRAGEWKITFEHRNITYTYELETIPGEIPNKPGKIIKDNLWQYKRNKPEPLVERDENKFTFNGEEMPLLSPIETSISLLKVNPEIKPVYEAFTSIMRREFSLEKLTTVLALAPLLPQHDMDKSFTENQVFKQIYREQDSINVSLYLLKKYCYKTYKNLIDNYKRFFPFIRNVKFIDLSQIQQTKLSGKIPVFMIQENGSDDWIPQMGLSSGMLKVLLILTDLYLLPEEGVYLIDEYENSLGISAIDFFPEFVLTFEKKVQFLITSHHPYLINKIPIKNWYIFHRDGVNIQIKYGKELEDKYGKSKQQAFLQLINDPFYIRK